MHPTSYQYKLGTQLAFFFVSAGIHIAKLARFYSTQSNNRYWATLSTCDTTDLRIDNIIVDRQIHRHRYTDTQIHRHTDTQTHFRFSLI